MLLYLWNRLSLCGFEWSLLLMGALLALGSPSLASPQRIAAAGSGFIDTVTGETFQPVGFNYIRLAGDPPDFRHSTFEPGVYDSHAADLMFDRLASAGYNTVRVFIDQTPGVGAVRSDGPGLSQTYMDNFVDFAQGAREHGLHVMPTFPQWVPTNTAYTSLISQSPSRYSGTPVTGVNRLIFNQGHIDAKGQFLYDFAAAVHAADPTLSSTILAYSIANEANLLLDEGPLNLDTGSVTWTDPLNPQNTRTWDLSLDGETGKQGLVDHATQQWANQLASRIREAAPDVMVAAGVFSYIAVDRIGPGDFVIQTGEDPRVPLRPVALTESSIDFLDLHLYARPFYTLEEELDSIEWSQGLADALDAEGMPVIVGEFGVKRNPGQNYAMDVEEAWSLLETHLEGLLAEQMDGYLMWTYDTFEQPNTWTGMHEDGVILERMAEFMRERGIIAPAIPEPAAALPLACMFLGLTRHARRRRSFVD